MAATSNKYSQDTLNDKDGANSAKNIYALIPLALTEYKQDPTDSSESLATSDAGFCEKFWCDSVWHFKDSDSNECVVGLLVATPSGAEQTLHANMHGGSSDPHPRKGKLRLMKNGVAYIVLNDGGLNTKAWADLNYSRVDENSNVPLPPIVSASTLGLTFAMNYKNAYYCNTTMIQVEVQVCNQSGTATVSPRTYTVPGIVTAMKYSDYFVDPYIVTIEDVRSYGDFVKDAYFKIRLITTNEEGVYTAAWSPVYQVSDAPATWTVYKVTSLDQNPDDGIRYDIIIKGGYSGTGDPASPFVPHGYYRAAAHEDTEVPSGTGYEEFDYPTLYNLIGGVPYQWQPTGTPGIDASVAAGTTREVSFALTGSRYGSSDDIFTTPLPEGMYANFPTVYPYDRGQENVDSTIWPYIPRLNSSSAQVKPIVYVNSSSKPFKWNASTYVPPTPYVEPEITAVTCQIATSSSDTDWYGYVINNNNIITFGVKPKVTVTGKGNVSIPIIIEWYDQNYDDVILGSSSVFTAYVSLGQTTTTKTIDVEYGEVVGTDEFPFFEATFNAPVTASTGAYVVRFRVITDGDYAISPTPTGLSEDWEYSNEWVVSEE